MESTVNDFLDEINEIIPLKKGGTKKGENEWKECLDSKSGFSYYWNTKTNEVTWEKPPNFVGSSPTLNGTIPNIPDIKDKVKIYRISATQTQNLPKSNGNVSTVKAKKAPAVKKRSRSDSDDEKITLITSYGSSSSSESESESTPTVPKKQTQNEDNEEDILSTVIKRAEELKKLGNVDSKPLPKPSEVPSTTSKTSKPISGFSLVAGYDSNSEDEEDLPEASKQNQALSVPVQGHSTLFPIMKAPDINDFKEDDDKPKKTEKVAMESPFDMKNFKRKRRLGVSFVPTRSNARPASPKTVENERKGFGFKENEEGGSKPPENQAKSLYSNFTKGSVEFVKPESEKDGKTEEDEENVDEKKLTEVYEILREKLAFLCEGNKDVMPVQIILIQIETLYGAMKADSLNPKYLQDWLEGTSEDLIKLEKEAAPEGWNLRWDRLEKRYSYHNETTGHIQWEYPQEEFERDEEAMDICTTPPPPDIKDQPIEEPTEILPSNRIPSPPPAPIISQPEAEVIPKPITASISSKKIKPSSQPLPPGVDSSESTSHEVKDIDSAFNSFYSELAEIEKTSKPCSPTTVETAEPTTEKIEEPVEPVKKKKKKMKLNQGLSLKNKDVSKLVEKWKNAQNNL